MHVPVEWLRDYVDFDLEAEDVAKELTAIGLAVESIEDHHLAGPVLEIDVTANRSDCYGVLGLARELAAAIGKEFKMPDLALEESSSKAGDLFTIEVVDADLCPRYTARIVEGVTDCPSPEWMQKRLEGAGLRPISAIVDVTNYVMLEFCQPLHAFDLELLKDKIIVRRAADKEKMTLLDETKLEMNRDNLVIADASGPVALAGVMGGLESEIRPSTSTVLIESAQFERVNVRRTARRNGKSTDSSFRFERGVDPIGVELASRRAAGLIASITGGKVAAGLIDVWATEWNAPQVSMRFARCDKLLGLVIDPDESVKILTGLGLELVERDGEKATFAVPPWREDLTREVDLIEEVVRIHGYHKVPEALTLKIAAAGRNPLYEFKRDCRKMMNSLGYDEAMTDSFVDARGAGKFGFWSGGGPLNVDNPLSSFHNALRDSLIPNLLAAKKNNQDAGADSVSLFEAANVYLRDAAGELDERPVLAMVDDRSFFTSKGSFFTVKGSVEALCDRLGISDVRYFYEENPRDFAHGRFLQLQIGEDTVLGCIGEVSKDIVAAYDLKAAPAVAEIALDVLLSARKTDTALQKIPRFPAVKRDVALIVDGQTKWSVIKMLAKEKRGKYAVDDVKFVSVFEGEPIPAGKKSVALSVLYRADDRTLTDDEVNTVHDEFTAKLAGALSADIRGA